MGTTVVTQAVIPLIGMVMGNGSDKANPVATVGESSPTADFSSLIASLFSNIPASQVQPEAALPQGAVLPENEGAGEVLPSDTLLVKGKGGGFYLLQQLLPANAPAATDVAASTDVMAADDSGEQVQQLPPETAYLITLNPAAFVSLNGINHAALENSAQITAGKGDVPKTITVSLATAKGGEIVVPVELKSGEKITLLFNENPAGPEHGKAPVDAGNRAEVRHAAPDMKPNPAFVAMPVRSAIARVVTEIIRQGAPATEGSSSVAGPAEVTRGVETVRSAVAPVSTQVQGGSPMVSQEVVRIVVVVKNLPQAVVPLMKDKLVIPGQKGMAPGDEVSAVLNLLDSDDEAPVTVQAPQTVTKGNTEMPAVASSTSKALPVDMKEAATAKDGAGILVLNQSPRHVEVVVRPEKASAAENSQRVEALSGAGRGQSLVKEASGEISGLAIKTATVAETPEIGKSAKVEQDMGAIPVAATSSVPESIGRVEAASAKTSPEVPVEHVLEQVSNKASSLAGKTLPSEMIFRLEPDRLGNLQMKVSVEGDQVVMKIQVDNPAVKHVLENNLGQLRDSFGNVGLKMESISVSLGMNSGNLNSGWERGQGTLGQGWQERAGGQAQYAPGHEANHRRDEHPAMPNPYRSARERLLDMMI